MATTVKLTRKVDGKTETYESDNPEHVNSLLAAGWEADAKQVDKVVAEQSAPAKK